jgi:hypothetical protein
VSTDFDLAFDSTPDRDQICPCHGIQIKMSSWQRQEQVAYILSNIALQHIMLGIARSRNVNRLLPCSLCGIRLHCTDCTRHTPATATA